MVEIEVLLARSLGWSLYAIDETDASHLLNFVTHLTSGKTAPAERRRYADEVDWL